MTTKIWTGTTISWSEAMPLSRVRDLVPRDQKDLTPQVLISKSMPSRISSSGSMANARPTPIRLAMLKSKADWATGNVAMTGLSWAGTTTFGVAATGVEGLKTIVPAAGIASWYDYFNIKEPSLAMRLIVTFHGYPSTLARGCWTKTTGQGFGKTIPTTSTNWTRTSTPMIVTTVMSGRSGIIPFIRKISRPAPWSSMAWMMTNVKTKHFELMYDALKKAGQDVKLYLHQKEITSIQRLCHGDTASPPMVRTFMTCSIPGWPITSTEWTITSKVCQQF